MHRLKLSHSFRWARKTLILLKTTRLHLSDDLPAIEAPCLLRHRDMTHQKEIVMKNKQQTKNRTTPSPKQKAPPQQLTHQFIELLSEKIDEVQTIIKDTPIHLTEPEETDSDFLDDFDPTDMRFQTPDAETLTGSSSRIVIQNDAASNSGQSAAAIARRTSFQYAPKETKSYNYGFTNNEFFAFIGSLDPVEYILVITVIAIIVGVEFNVFELQILGGALVDIGVTLGNMVEQQLFQQARKSEIFNRERNEAEQNDFDTLYDDIDALQAQINELKRQLNNQPS